MSQKMTQTKISVSCQSLLATGGRVAGIREGGASLGREGPHVYQGRAPSEAESGLGG